MEPVLWMVVGFLLAFLFGMLIFRRVISEKRSGGFVNVDARLVGVIENISMLVSRRMSDEQFLDESMNLISDFLGGVKECVLSVFEGGKWKIVGARGERVGKFRGFEFDGEDISVPRETKFLSTEVEALQYIPASMVAEFLDSNMGNTMVIVPLRFLDDVKGVIILRRMYVDSPFELEEERRIVDGLSRIIASLYGMRELLSGLKES